MAEFKVGLVSRFYKGIGVAVFELNSDLGTGDIVKFVEGEIEIFEQRIEYLQVGSKKLTNARKGETVGLKTIKEVNEGTEIYKKENS